MLVHGQNIHEVVKVDHLGQERGPLAVDVGTLADADALADAQTLNSLREGFNKVPLLNSGCRTSFLGLTCLSGLSVAATIINLLLFGTASRRSSSSPLHRHPHQSHPHHSLS